MGSSIPGSANARSHLRRRPGWKFHRSLPMAGRVGYFVQNVIFTYPADIRIAIYLSIRRAMGLATLNLGAGDESNLDSFQ